ncbi:hypothetical protein ACYFX5_23210 [Bremerella sp. T1]|uniref:hypothetical protein n=1 Tax=Bremerella sp. TYQ1 TaxID=3119568 RepID=UPI001CCE81E1|nr:hypothetical protein [Bremerella volcania]UBM35942.1 hypothetical protein LA756_25155 [Bremerella volcania]
MEMEPYSLLIAGKKTIMLDTATSFSLAPFFVAFLFVLGGFMTLASGHLMAQDLSSSAIVELTTASGRTFRGSISPKSDFSTVHVVTSRGSMSISRPIAWTAIRELTINESPASFEKLATLIARVQQDDNSKEPTPGYLVVGPASKPVFSERPEPRQEIKPQSAPVSNLSAWATFKNWDRNPSVDGLEVTFNAEDAQGLPTTVRGHLEAELYAFQSATFDTVPHGQGARFIKIGSWSIPLDKTFARYDSRVARLPYQSNSPANDGSISPLGTLVVKLVVPGQGTFTTSMEDVRLRPYSAIRDANELRGNPRYPASENPRYAPYVTP